MHYVRLPTDDIDDVTHVTSGTFATATTIATDVVVNSATITASNAVTATNEFFGNTKYEFAVPFSFHIYPSTTYHHNRTFCMHMHVA
ncbi:unnamed protein product [Onchocerca flexuosa]|uniref:Uncharacterized protein n=1 Tax=Onchocerca flexuosa TaxID=387005 RepID=A0A183I6P8_9BILA|nr:unnamed protein product [Onchocerca flexuosa]